MNSRSLVLLLTVVALSGSMQARAAGESPTASGPDGGAGQAVEWGAFEIRSRAVAPGTKEKFTFAQGRSFEGSFLDAALWVAHGSSPGRTLCVVSGIHGDEINSVEIARRTFHGVDPQRLAGTLIVLPAVNAMGFRTMNRYMLDRRDLNRAFPGSIRGSVASIVANVVFENVVRRCDSLIDLHTGSNFRANMPQIRVDLGHPASLRLAEAFGVGVIVGGAGSSGSLRREAVRVGVAAIIYEAGPPYAFVPKEIESGTRGVFNAMSSLGMYEAMGERKRPQKVVRSGWVRVPKRRGGIFLTSVGLGARVKQGDLLGTVTDPVTDEEHEVRSDRDGIVIGAALPQVVLSGYGLFHIGELE